jgi:hypothetical protein
VSYEEPMIGFAHDDRIFGDEPEPIGVSTAPSKNDVMQ